MNTEVIKAMNKKDNTIQEWWRKNGYKIERVIFFPLWLGEKAQEKIKTYIYSKNQWNEKRANEILSYYIPRKAKWDKNNKCFYFTDNGMGWEASYNKKLIKLRDRIWWNYNCGMWGGKIKTYLIEKFEMEGFEKEVGDTYDEWVEVTFYLIENN